jgi:hypothetical protein
VTAAVAPTAACDEPAVALAPKRAPMPWSVVVLAVPAVIGAVRLVVPIRRPYDLWGDHAIFEAAIRRVLSGTQTLGPYSRFGFHQLGPAYFEAQAPFYWLSGMSPRALFVGALGLNLGSALGCVLVIRRFRGEGPARWAAVVIGAYVVALTPSLVADPWTVYVLGLPFLLTMLLAAAAATGSLAAAAGAVVGASYLVQTHISTAATVAVILVTAGGLFALGIRHRCAAGEPAVDPPHPLGVFRPRSPRRALVAAAAALAVMWLPPLWEQVTHNPGNVSTLLQFFRQSHPESDSGVDHSLAMSARQLGRQLALLPDGHGVQNSSRPLDPARPLDVAVIGAGLLAAAGVAVAGRRRRDTFLMALGAFPLAGTAAAVWATTRVVGVVYPYLLLWASALLLPAWIGLGFVAATASPATSRRWHRAATGVATAGVAVVAVVAGWSMLRSPSPPLRSSADVTAAGDLARHWLTGHGVGGVRVEFDDHDEWPLAAGVIDHLQRTGVAVTVERNYVFLFGDQFAPHGRDGGTVWLTLPNHTPPGPGRFDRLGEAGGSVVWAGSVSPS